MTSAFTQVVSLQDVSRLVIKNMAAASESSTLTPHQVQSVFKCIGKFISYMFKKSNYDWVIADIATFGTVLRNNNVSYFVPSICL
jgi:hypothetical protein